MASSMRSVTESVIDQKPGIIIELKFNFDSIYDNIHLH